MILSFSFVKVDRHVDNLLLVHSYFPITLSLTTPCFVFYFFFIFVFRAAIIDCISVRYEANYNQFHANYNQFHG